jgi:uncharacterized protein (TIGR02231 family)
MSNYSVLEVLMKRIRIISLIFFLFFSLFLSLNLFSAEIVAKSSISSVTIYPDRASITREITLSLGSGTHSVVFEGLPSTLIPNSLRVSGKGTAIVKILGLDVSTAFLESPLLPEIKKLQGEIGALEMEMTKTKDAIEVLESQEKFLKSIESTSISKASQEVALGKPDILTWEKVIGFLGSKLQEIKQSKLEQLKILKEQQTKLDTLKKKLDSMAPQKPLEAKKVTVLLESSRPGEFELNLSYTVVNARWVPLYTVRALPDSSEIELSISGNIQQKSGEDWDDVRALLSTSSPSLGTNPPELNPWILDIFVPRPVLQREAKVVGGVEKAAAPRPEEAAFEIAEAEMAYAGIQESGIHLNFEIKRNVQIPSDGAPHKVPIDSQKMNVKFDYISVPKLKEAAFLRGNLQNTLPYPLLSGSADLFIIQDFVGSTQIPYVATEEEAKMFFGEDRQIVVKYEQLKREKTAPGFLGKTEKVRLIYKITVQNLRKNQVDAEILDQLPVSQNSKIEVKDINISPSPSKKDEKGVLTWNFSLTPQEKREILIDFTVEYPKGANILGL